MCLLDFYTTQILTSTTVLIHCISWLINKSELLILIGCLNQRASVQIAVSLWAGYPGNADSIQSKDNNFPAKYPDWIAGPISFVEKRKHELKPLPYWEPPIIIYYHTKLFARANRCQGFVHPWATTRFCFDFLALIINNLNSGHPEMETIISFQRLVYIYLRTLKDTRRKSAPFLTHAVYRLATMSCRREWQYHMLHVYNVSSWR